MLLFVLKIDTTDKIKEKCCSFNEYVLMDIKHRDSMIFKDRNDEQRKKRKEKKRICISKINNAENSGFLETFTSVLREELIQN